ncbi:MAG: CoA ester lyase [Melioribacteraceae bacterium]|nr:MAG: CoA ester lyase [Melioribacteraceae bacterium]
MKSYFFIPADKQKFIAKMDSIGADEFVFDFEDALAENLYETALENVKEKAASGRYFVRPKLFNDSGELEENVLHDLVRIGFRKFILPKVSSTKNLAKIEKSFLQSRLDLNEFKFILLIEDPHGLLFAKDLVQKSGLNIVGIGLGSHDYTKQIGMTHTLENLYYARTHVLNVAKAFKIEAVDIASMNISNESEFDIEIKTGFELGYDSKFIIHPMQLERLKKYTYYSDSMVLEAREVYQEIQKYSSEDFSVVKVNGKIFEKPHIERIKKIVEWADENGTK